MKGIDHIVFIISQFLSFIIHKIKFKLKNCHFLSCLNEFIFHCHMQSGISFRNYRKNDIRFLYLIAIIQNLENWTLFESNVHFLKFFVRKCDIILGTRFVTVCDSIEVGVKNISTKNNAIILHGLPPGSIHLLKIWFEDIIETDNECTYTIIVFRELYST